MKKIENNISYQINITVNLKSDIKRHSHLENGNHPWRKRFGCLYI
jgi:hypothetical protein